VNDWLTEEQAEALVPVICDIPFANEYCPHAPEPPQHAYLSLEQLEALYGGAAGGGKSDALLMAALQYVDVPGYSAIIMRRTFAELSLEGALMSRAHSWLGHTDATWNGNENRWRFPGSGASLQFGYLSNENDRARYQSAEFQFIGIDELTDWNEQDYRFMFSRLRGPGFICDACNKSNPSPDLCEECGGTELHAASPLSWVPLRMRAATNPGGRGHRWVKGRFLDRNDGAPSYVRPFIPAKLSDNPHLNQSAYLNALQQLDPGQAQMLIEGNWDAREPGDWVIGDPRWVDAAVELGARALVRWTTTARWRRPAHRDGLGRAHTELRHLGARARRRVHPAQRGGGSVARPGPDQPLHHRVGAALQLALAERPLRRCRRAEHAHDDEHRATRAGAGAAEELEGAVQPVQVRHHGLPAHAVPAHGGGETTRVIAIHPDNAELIWQLKDWKFKKIAGTDTVSNETIKENDHGPDAVVAGTAHIAARHRAYIEEAIEGAMPNAPAYEEANTYEYTPTATRRAAA
jgi:hypothetical protein